MTPTAASDVTGVLFGVLISLLLTAGLYIWIALALSAVFRKSGEEGWKAWVPVLNSIVLLQLAGLSPWLVLLSFVPILNIAAIVVFAIAIYRVSGAFGYGAGMTVLGVLLFPVWASVIGWGSARWVGREVAGAQSGHSARGARASAAPGARRSSDAVAALPPLPPFPSAAAPAGVPGSPVYPGDASAPTPFSGFAPPPAYPAPPVSTQDLAGAPVEPRPDSAADPSPPTNPAPVRASSQVAPPAEGWAPPAGGWTPPPLPGRPVAASGAADPASADAPGASEDDPWQGFALDSTDLSAEVTGAVPGAPAPVSAVSPSAAEPIPFTPDAFAAPASATTGDGITRPPVTRVPAPDAADADREPWMPARSPMNDADAFPESSGPVSAVAGAPDAGSPRAARSSVSAFHAKPEIPDEDEALDHTIIARRKRTDWSLVPPTGDPIALVSDVVILGRRPATDPEYPSAQLVAIQDGTVSKTHARLQLRGDRWYVTDLDSTNGVLFATLMGTEVEATPGEEVEAGDRFLMGDAEIRLVRSEE